MTHGVEPTGHGDARRDAALERYRTLRPAVEDGVPLVRAARYAGVPLRTAQRWMADYKREGLAGLAPKSAAATGAAAAGCPSNSKDS